MLKGSQKQREENRKSTDVILTFISKGESAQLWETLKFFKANRSRCIDSHNSYLILFNESWTRFRFFASFLVH